MEKVEDEWERELELDAAEDLDLLFVKYDAKRVSIEEMLATIKEHGFQGKVKHEE